MAIMRSTQPRVGTRFLAGRHWTTQSSKASIVFGLLSLLALVSHAASNPTCEVDAAAGDAREFTCTLGQSAGAGRYRIEAGFSGSHDDSVLDMTAVLDGKPVACAEGSTTHSQGEDGDIALVCRFDLKGEATASVFKVKLRWRHADPADFNVASE
jgi:hypothetical protein